VFHLEYHIPYLALRRRPPNSSNPTNCNAKKKASLRRTKIDLSFLDIDCTGSQTDAVWEIHEAQFSLLICGIDRFRWTSYAFANTNPNNSLNESGFDPGRGGTDSNLCRIKIDDDEDCEEGANEDEDDDELNVDPTASDARGAEVAADRPIWDPREYYLRIIDLRTKRVLDEWTEVVRKIKRSIERHVSVNQQKKNMLLTIFAADRRYRMWCSTR
jgi:hypothetical protein